MKKSKIAQFLLIILYLLLGIGIICLIPLPWLYNLFSDGQITTFQDQTIYYQIAFYMCYSISLGIVYTIIHIFHFVYSGTPFRKELEHDLIIVAILFMSLAAIIGIKTVFIPTILSAAVALVTFIASLSFYVLSQIFKVAIEYKQEIDYTV